MSETFSLDDCPPEALTFWRDYAAQLEADEPYVETFGVKVPSEGARRLQKFWEHGKGGAEVGWGSKGAMQRCVALNRKHMRDPGGYCALRHRAVTGEWPTEHGKAGIPS